MKRFKCMYVFVVVLVSAFTYSQESLKMFVKESKVPCQGVGPMECLQVKYDKDKEWQLFYDHIEGFNFEKGNRYEIMVTRTKRPEPIPADASSYQYKLKSIISKTPVNTEKGIYNTKMILTQLNGKKINSGKAFITINGETVTISGKNGCNNFNIKYTKLSAKNQIKTNSPIGTLMACDDESMKLEQEFSAAITKKKFKIVKKNNTVQFKNAKNKVVMEFSIPTQDQLWSFIEKNNWKLIALENVGQDYGRASIKFNVAEKKVSGNTGCNNFSGSYETNDDRISFDKVASTRMACIGEGNETEQKMLSYLNNKDLRFDVADQTLNFYLNDKLVMMFGITK
ncbi:META domain-containing protein [Flavobacterium tyrosinilyticum]|uniref:META domain-containing protein n=1 Tax=Flavobacterium tyrosinilyticum TaxID=1658740 RepID=UPI00202EE540|nr:META domain-containing protein [Flavobacterium tyrosinilyticum]MCM0667025.1 META domain-containing protein [Flavobacterium tyrosinilyticum]